MSLLNAPGFWCMQQIVQFIASMAVDEAESTMFLQALNIVIKLSVSVVVGVIVLCLLLLLCGIAIITLVAIGFYTRHVGSFNTRTYTCTTSCNTWPPHLCSNIRFMFVMPIVFHVFQLFSACFVVAIVALWPPCMFVWFAIVIVAICQTHTHIHIYMHLAFCCCYSY